MLVYFTPDQTVFNEDADSLVGHKRLMKIWRLHGVLAYAGPFEGSGIRNFIKSAPGKIRSLWEVELKRQKRANLSKGSSDVGGFESTCQNLSTRPGSAVILGEKGWAAKGLNPADNCQPFSPAAHWQRFCAIDTDGPFSVAMCLKQRDITSDISREEVWNVWLEDYVRLERHLIVYDQYCLETFLRKQSSPFDSGLGFLLKQVAATGFESARVIEIFSATEIDKAQGTVKAVVENAHELFKRFCERELSGGSVGRVKLHTCFPSEWSKKMHRRYLRLGDHYWVKADWGLQPFDLERKGPNCSLVVTDYSEKSNREEEGRLRSTRFVTSEVDIRSSCGSKKINW